MALVAPSDLVATAISSSRIDIAWTNKDNYDRIRVYRGKGDTEAEAVAALGGYRILLGSSEYMEDKGWELGVVVGLEADKWYAYKIFGFTVHPDEASAFAYNGIILIAAGYIDCVPGDIGKQVKDGGVAIGLLKSYDNTLRRWFIDTAEVVANGSNMTIADGTGEGTAERQTYCAKTFMPLEKPTEVVATPISDTKIDLMFKDNSETESWNRVERRLDAGAWGLVKDLEPNREFFRDQSHVLMIAVAGYAECGISDIGKQVKDDGGEIGVLLSYNNATYRWTIDSETIIADGSVMTITDGTGAGDADGASVGIVADSLYTYRVHAMQVEDDYELYASESAQVVTFDVPTPPVLAAILAADTKDKSIRIRWPGVVEGQWKTAILYHVNDWVGNNGNSYICILEHTSEATREPGIGVSWITYWEVVTSYRIEKFIQYGTAFWSHVGLDAYDGTKVNDGLLVATAFETDTSGANSHLKIDLGVGIEKEFVRVDITIITAEVNAIWDVEYSDDDATWEKAKEDVGGTPLAVGTHEFTWSKAGAHRYWRLLKTNVAVAGGAFAEIQFYEQTKEIGAEIVNFLVEDLDVSTDYWFKIRAYNAAGNSAYSNIVTATTLAAYVLTEFEKWIRDPNTELIYLAEIYTKMDLTDFVIHGAGPAWMKTIGAEDRGIDILEVFEDGTAYTAVANIAAVEALASSFWFDYANRILYVRSSAGDGDPAAFLIEGAFWLYFSTHKDIEFTVASGRLTHYLPLLAKEDIPDITQEIKPYYEGSFLISSASIAFINGKIGENYFFDIKYKTYTWENSKVILKSGKGSTYANFETILTSLIDKKNCNDSKITFTLRDIRQEMERDLILTKFTAAAYPDIEEDFIGEPIPICFGIKYRVVPIPINVVRRKYKFHDGRSKSVEAVYKNPTGAGDTALVEDTDYFVDLQRSIITFERDTFVLSEEDIIEIAFIGSVNSADEPISNGAEVFKHFMNEHYGLLNSELNLDSIYKTKYAKTNPLSIFLYKDQPYREIVRTIEHSSEAYTFQDPEGRLGLKIQLAVAESKAKYIRNYNIFNHRQSKSRKLLFWKVNVFYNELPQSQEWEVKSAQDDNIFYRYKNKNELNIYSYFSVPSPAQDLATSILALLNKETIEDTVSMLLFDVSAGDITKFSRTRFYKAVPSASDINLRIIRISKSPASGRTSINMELV